MKNQIFVVFSEKGLIGKNQIFVVFFLRMG